MSASPTKFLTVVSELLVVFLESGTVHYGVLFTYTVLFMYKILFTYMTLFIYTVEMVGAIQEYCGVKYGIVV